MKRVFVIGLLLLLILPFASCSFHRSYTLEGYVYETYRKSPLPGITILANDLMTVTDGEGFFRIKNLPTNKFPILVGKNKNYSDLIDTLLLDQKVNHRDFVLNAKHPMDIDLSSYHEPSSYAFTYHSIADKKIPLSIFSGRSVPIDESLNLLGKFFDQKNSWKKIEIVQIGLSFFEKDEYNNWNETSKPNIQALQFQSDAGDLIKKAYHFFEDPLLSFKEEPETISIEGVKTVLYHVKEVNPKENPQQYDVFLVKDGNYKGQVKKIIRTTYSADKQMETSLILNQWNEDFQILPPQITQ